MSTTGTGLPTDNSGVPVNVPGLPDFTISVTDVAPPSEPTDLPRQHIEKYFRDAYSELKSMGVPQWAALIIAGMIIAPAAALMVLKDLVIVVLRVVLPTWGGEVLQSLDDLRKALDPEFAEMAVSVLNELLGTDIAASDMPMGGGFTDHLARADKVGGILHDVLMSEFAGMTTITPATGRQAARRFSGLMINFGTATGVLATLGGMIPQIHLDEIREIGEQVAQNLGLGRLGRQVLRPIVQTMMEKPYTWWINQQYRPTQLTVGDVVNPFSGAVLDHALVHDSLANEGYSDDKIAALIELHQKKLSESDFWLLYETGFKQQSEVLAYFSKIGYSDDDAKLRLEAETRRTELKWETQIVAAVIEAYAAGHIQSDEFQSVIKSVVHLADEQALIVLLAQYKMKVPTKHLTITELTLMLEQNLMTTDDVSAYLTRLGYSQDDSFNLLMLILSKVNAAEAKAKAAAAKAAKSAATATSGDAGSGSTPPATTGS